MRHVLAAGSSVRPRGTSATTTQTGRPGVLPIFLIGAAIPAAVWAVAWYLENVVEPGCGDDPYFGCIFTYAFVPLFALVAAVVGGIAAAAIANRDLWWHRPLALIAGLGVATVVLVAVAFWPKPVEWRPDPMKWFVRPLASTVLCLGIPALLSYGVVTLLRWLSMRWSHRRYPAGAEPPATDPAVASVSAGRFWDGTRWVDEGAVPTGPGAVEPSSSGCSSRHWRSCIGGSSGPSSVPRAWRTRRTARRATWSAPSWSASLPSGSRPSWPTARSGLAGSARRGWAPWPASDPGRPVGGYRPAERERPGPMPHPRRLRVAFPRGR